MSDESQHGSEWVPENQENEASNDANGKKNGSEAPLPVAPAKPNLAPAKGHDCCKKYKRIKEEIKYWFELGGLFAGVAVLIVLIGQLREMVKATKVTEGQLKAMQSQSDVMQDQLDEMQRTRTLDERAWVAARQVVIKGTDFPNNTFIVVFKNTGKTPAISVSAFMNQSTITNVIPAKDQPASPINTLSSVQFSGLLAPDAEGTMAVNSLLFGFVNPEGEAIRIGIKPYYIYGTVWYDDIFGKHHWSQFCYEIRFSPNADVSVHFLPINIHNSCDDAEAGKGN
jgi:hypothetical protein